MKEQEIAKYEEIFDHAKSQVLFLDPEFDTKVMGAYKKIVNNKIFGSDSESNKFSNEEGIKSPENPPALEVLPESADGPDGVPGDAPSSSVCQVREDGDGLIPPPLEQEFTAAEGHEETVI